MTQKRQAGKAVKKVAADRVIGLDAHPYMFTAAVVTGQDARTATIDKVYDRIPLEQLERVMKTATTSNDVIVLEASGNAFSVVARLEAIGRRALVLDSAAAASIGKRYAITDKIDAVKLARVYISGLADIVWTPDAKAAERRELFFAYENAKRDSIRVRNRLWNWLSSHGMKAPKRQHLSNPETFQTIAALPRWTPLEREILAGMANTYIEIHALRRRLYALIANEVAKDPAVLKMIRLLGVRNIVAFAVAAFVGDITRFANAKKLVAYFGLNPSVLRSGEKGGTGPLAHCGRSDVRSLLIQAAQSILRYGSDATHKWAVALKMRKGANIAVCALARKLVVAIWYLLSGHFTPLKEADQKLRIKLTKLASDIGEKIMRNEGYKSTHDFIEEKVMVLLKTT
jgi:transposase